MISHTQRLSGAVGGLLLLSVTLAGALLGCAGLSGIAIEDREVHAARSMEQMEYASAAAFKQSVTELHAPELRDELQLIADEVAFAGDMDVRPRVHLVNSSAALLIAYEHGELFICSGYLDIIDSRDEIAFGIARELAAMSHDLRLQRAVRQFRIQRSAQFRQRMVGLIAASAISTALAEPARRASEEIWSPPPVYAIPLGDEVFLDFAKINLYRDTFSLIHLLTFGGVANDVSGKVGVAAMGLVSDGASRMVEDLDQELREEKDRLGRVLLLQAGYDPLAADLLIEKFEFLENLEESADGGGGRR